MEVGIGDEESGMDEDVGGGRGRDLGGMLGGGGGGGGGGGRG